MGYDPRALEGGQYSQTLDRGVRVLEHLASRGGVRVSDVAGRLGVHRSVAYRLIRTLEAHRLVRTRPDGGLELGLGLLSLAKQVDWDVRDAALPVLTRLADRTRATSLLSVLDGSEVVTLIQSVPRTGAHISLGEGLRHPLDRGSPGIALSAVRSPRTGERSAVSRARRRGFARSDGELASGTIGISTAVPVETGHEATSAVTVVFLKGERHDEGLIAEAVREAAAEIGGLLP